MSKKEKIEVEDIVNIEGVNEIPEEAEEVEEVEIVTKEEYKGDLRGFKTLAEAKEYPYTPEFQRLDKGCRTEYVDWLKTITKED